jgi:anti-sigma regulatory factor (Ser/Thr protein kinase)
VPSTMFDERQFDRHLSAGRHARRFVTGVLRRWGCDVLVDDACLVVTELVSNAIVHGTGEPKVVVVHRDDGLLLEVHDTNPDAPVVRVLDPLGASGFGLHLVSGVSEAWGMRRVSPGKVVWCLFARPSPPTASPACS